MSSHFNYEIEERNMRNQLKELEVSFKEEAWLNYESYAKQFQNVNKTQLIPNFNFALNRTVILPVVFGSIIVLFSFLLFNFINIKNTKTKGQVSELKAAITPPEIEKSKPKPQKTNSVPVKKEEAVKEAPAVTNTVATPVSIINNNSAVKTPPTQIANVANTNPAVNTTIDNTQLAKTAATYTVEPKKKRRRKNNAEVLESITTPVSLPTVTQEEAEPELR